MAGQLPEVAVPPDEGASRRRRGRHRLAGRLAPRRANLNARANRIECTSQPDEAPATAGAAPGYSCAGLSRRFLALLCSQRSTDGKTNLLTSPPRIAISRTIVQELNWYWSDGVINKVSN